MWTEHDVGEQIIDCDNCLLDGRPAQRRAEIERYLRTSFSPNLPLQDIAAAAEALDLLKYHLKSDQASVTRWMNTPRPELGGRTSIQAVREGDSETVRGLVHELLRQEMRCEFTD